LKVLYRQARTLAGRRADLDDIVQAAAERTLKALARFEGRSELTTYTYGIVWRTLLDHDRWLSRWHRRFVLGMTEEPEAIASGKDGEHALLDTRRAERLEAALSQLSAQKRATLVLHDVEGYSASEVASILGTREGTVRSRLRDARLKVAEQLRTDPAFETEDPK
jgi:RNA polymerase sigma-70 factor (ECF subfamily)